MSETELALAYAAGVIDSDGYIGVHTPKYAERDARGWQVTYQPRVQVKQVTPQAIDLLHELFGGHRYIAKPSARRGRPLISWAVHSAAAGRVCEMVRPYLRIKPRQAENVIEVCRLNRLPKRYVLPEIEPGEPMVTMIEAARITGRGYGSVTQAVYQGSMPHVRLGARKVLVPASFLETWVRRGAGGTSRSESNTAELERCLQLSHALNRVGV